MLVYVAAVIIFRNYMLVIVAHPSASAKENVTLAPRHLMPYQVGTNQVAGSKAASTMLSPRAVQEGTRGYPAARNACGQSR